MHVTEWKEPALFWNGSVSELARPRLLEIRNDEFIPTFLQAMMGSDPTPFFQKHQIDATYNPSQPIKLYQPLHGCYYLITASLVCRQVGLPDKAINRADGESISFVIRRLGQNGEEAWVPEGESGSWVSATDVQSLVTGEERLSMHPVTVCSKPATPRSVFTDNVERDLHYGYIPTGNRDKYIETLAQSTATPTTGTASESPETLVNDFLAQAEVDAAADGVAYSYRGDLFQRRVHAVWSSLLARGVLANVPTTEQEQLFYILLELGDFIQNNLPSLWSALVNNNADGLPESLGDLFDALRDDWIVDRTTGFSDRSFCQALVDLAPLFSLVRGEGTKPDENYNINQLRRNNSAVTATHINGLKDLVDFAVADETEPIRLPDGEDSEIVRLIRNQVRPTPNQEPVYVIRTAYEYDPECPPILSVLPSQPFEFAKFFDPDAPARLIRLEAPSIKPQDLRKYARGVGVQMSPQLHKITSCLSGDNAQEVIDSAGSCPDDNGLSIQMVCTFSIQIIFLVAFIVMFIFLIILNFVFWWLPFLRICLPIPKRT